MRCLRAQLERQYPQPEPVIVIKTKRGERNLETLPCRVDQHQIPLPAQVLVAISKQLVEVTLAETIFVISVTAIEPLPLGIKHPPLLAMAQQQVGLKLKHRSALMSA